MASRAAPNVGLSNIKKSCQFHPIDPKMLVFLHISDATIEAMMTQTASPFSKVSIAPGLPSSSIACRPTLYVCDVSLGALKVDVLAAYLAAVERIAFI